MTVWYLGWLRRRLGLFMNFFFGVPPALRELSDLTFLQLASTWHRSALYSLLATSLSQLWLNSGRHLLSGAAQLTTWRLLGCQNSQ